MGNGNINEFNVNGVNLVFRSSANPVLAMFSLLTKQVVLRDNCGYGTALPASLELSTTSPNLRIHGFLS